MRDGQDESSVDEVNWDPPVEAMLAMVMAWGVSADVAFGDAGE